MAVAAPALAQTNKVPVLLLNGDKTFPFIPFGADALSKVLANSSRGTLPGQDPARNTSTAEMSTG